MAASKSAFDTLVEALPRIAEAIAVFEAPEVQARAFDALATSVGRPYGPPGSTASGPRPSSRRRARQRCRNASEHRKRAGALVYGAGCLGR